MFLFAGLPALYVWFGRRLLRLCHAASAAAAAEGCQRRRCLSLRARAPAQAPAAAELHSLLPTLFGHSVLRGSARGTREIVALLTWARHLASAGGWLCFALLLLISTDT